jgi:CheY-like chemotaxis protein
MAQPRLNLGKLSVLLVDRNHYFRALVSQALRGFGIKHVVACDTAAAAQAYLSQAEVDLCLIEAELPDMSGAGLVRFIRRLKKDPLRFVPIILLSGYAQFRVVSEARDAGANLVLKKPISPQALFDQIAWLARTKRPYIEAESYIGPDRKFHDIDPPDGRRKRAKDKPEGADSSAPVPAQGVAS